MNQVLNTDFSVVQLLVQLTTPSDKKKPASMNAISNVFSLIAPETVCT